MAIPHNKGKFFLFLFLFLLQLLFLSSWLRDSSVFANSDSVPPTINEDADENGREVDAINGLKNRHQFQLEKLENLVRNLGDLVLRLDSQISGAPPLDERRTLQEKVEADFGKYDDGSHSIEKIRGGERTVAVSVTKYSPFWSERFQFVSAVKLSSDATSINILPFRDYEGLSKYVAVGDDQGRVYIFLRNGDLMLEFYTSSDSPITAMLSYLSVYKNESVVVTGHRNGLVLVHRVWEALSNGEEWTSLFLENVGSFAPPEIGEDGSSITILEVHHVRRIRYILSSDVDGKIRVLRENGVPYGLVVPRSRPLAFLKQRLLFLTETGVGSLDLRTMKVKESDCEGLNHSSVQTYVFDPTERSKAYGFTSAGDLIHVLLLGDVTNFRCRVRSKREFHMGKPLASQAIKGYLLVVDQEKVFVYNVTSQHYARAGGARLLFSAGLDEIRSLFLSSEQADTNSQRITPMPLLASDSEKLVVVGLGGGYVGIYHSKLPVFKGEFSAMLWSSPVLFFILFLFGAWQFFDKKKDSLTSWAPDDSFSSSPVPNGAPFVPGSADRKFTEPSSRNGDISDLRGGGGLRGPSRRYVSPSRYPGGSTSSFRTSSSADTESRPASIDPSFRSSTELKFRGSNLESTGFQKRRDSYFANNNVVDDRN